MKSFPWFQILAMIGLSAFLAASIQIHRSIDMTGLKEGQKRFKADGDMFRPINDLLELTVKKRDGVLTISEAEVNAWIDDKIVGKQRGVLAKFIQFERVWLDFHKHEDGLGRVEVIFERTEFGRSITQSATFRVRRNDKLIIITCDEVRFGRMRLSEDAFQLIAGPMKKLATLFTKEKELLLQFNTIHFLDEEILLEPRFRRVPGPDPITITDTP